MHATVHLSRLPAGGFRVQGATAGAIEAVAEQDALAVAAGNRWRLLFNRSERGWRLTPIEGEAEDAGTTSALSLSPGSSPSSVLLADGRLFRLAAIAGTDSRIELGRFDVPGAYLVARPAGGGWEMTRTIAGQELDMPEALWILTCAEIGRLDGWYPELQSAT